MSSTYDERHWYSSTGWRVLKARVLRVVADEAPGLLAALAGADEPEAAINAFLDAVVGRIGTAADQAVRAQFALGDEGVSPSSLWAFALPLFGEPEPLRQALLKDLNVLRGLTNRPVDAERALCEVVRRFIEDARIEMSPGSAQRRRNWEAIDRISRPLAERNLDNSIGDRRSTEHLVAVQAEIRRLFPTNKNINLSLGSLQAYFDEFDPILEGAGRGTEADGWEAVMAETQIFPVVLRCLEALRQEDMTLFESFLARNQLPYDDFDETQQAYLARTGLSRHALDQNTTKAAALLQDCCERSAEFQLRDVERRLNKGGRA